MFSRQRYKMHQDLDRWYTKNQWKSDNDYHYEYEFLPSSWNNVNVTDSFRPLDFRETTYQSPITNNNLADAWDHSDWPSSPWSAPKKCNFQSNARDLKSGNEYLNDSLKRRGDDYYWPADSSHNYSKSNQFETKYLDSDQQLWRTGAYSEAEVFSCLPKWPEDSSVKTWKFLNSFDPIKPEVSEEESRSRDSSPTTQDDVLTLDVGTDVPDVNLVSRSFNNFTVSTDKKAEILKMLRERRKTKYSNIYESQSKSEAKILNIGKNSYRNASISRRQRNVRSNLSSWNQPQQDIAETLVLEKVRYDPNWKRHNKALCSSDGSFKNFCNDVSITKPLKSAPIKSTKDESWTQVVQHQTKVDNPPLRVPESPIDNATPTEVVYDANSNKEKSNKNDSKKKSSTKTFEDFNISDIETTLPTIDWETMEAHLARSAAEEEWSGRRRYDREEIRRRLALETEFDDYQEDYPYFKAGKKPSLTTRLQCSMNMQICFMNETTSDSDNEDNLAEDTASSVQETKRLLPESVANDSTPANKTECTSPNSPTENNLGEGKKRRPTFFFAKQRSWRLRSRHKHENIKDKNATKDIEDFYTRQARLQTEARLALVQAKEMARMQMEIERQTRKKSPISDIVGLTFPEGKDFSLTKPLLNSMNIAQLQVLVNDFLTQIERLNDELVQILLTRDDLHMEQDSMLVDIEDLTRYLGAKNTNLMSLQNKLNSK